VEADRKGLRKRLKEAGLSDPLIDAAWPAWWSDDALSSQSAKAELRFAIARKLGLSPKSLFHDEVEFVWKDDARFKHLSNETDEEKAALTSFGISVCRILVQSLKPAPTLGSVAAMDLRNSILKSKPFIDLQSLLATCWAIGIPVIHLRVFPLEAKRMHAMAVKVGGRNVILLGRDAQYPAPVAFTLAHEIGHIMLGHIGTSSAVIDVGDPVGQPMGDRDEEDADRYALELLLGTSQPDIQTNFARFNAVQLATAVLSEGPKRQIEPGTLALCLAYASNTWPIANAAMQFIYTEQKPVWQEVNRIAGRELELGAIGDDSGEYLRRIMGMGDG
jgi:hypothetical protein